MSKSIEDRYGITSSEWLSLSSEECANLIGSNRKRLHSRFREAVSCLFAHYRSQFLLKDKPKLDFEKKKYIGKNGYFLQWENTGLTSIGTVYLQREVQS